MSVSTTAAPAVTPLDEEIGTLAQTLYLIDIRLRQATGPGWHSLSAIEQQIYRGRAALAIRLGDRTAPAEATQDAAIATQARHPHLVRDQVVAGPIATTAIAAWLASLSRV